MKYTEQLIKDVCEYYKTHTETETADRFNLKISKIAYIVRHYSKERKAKKLANKISNIDKEKLIEEIKTKNIAQIICEYNISYGSYCKLCKKLGIEIKSRKMTGILYKSQEFIDYCKSHTSKEIAEHYETEDYIIRNVCNKFGYEYIRSSNHKNRKVTDDRDMIKCLINSGFNYSDISRFSGISIPRISQIAKENSVSVYKNSGELYSAEQLNTRTDEAIKKMCEQIGVSFTTKKESINKILQYYKSTDVVLS